MLSDDVELNPGPDFTHNPDILDFCYFISIQFPSLYYQYAPFIQFKKVNQENTENFILDQNLQGGKGKRAETSWAELERGRNLWQPELDLFNYHDCMSISWNKYV